jgi:hypothetical protein
MNKINIYFIFRYINKKVHGIYESSSSNQQQQQQSSSYANSNPYNQYNNGELNGDEDMEEDGEFVDQDYNQDGEQYADDDYDDGEIIGDSEEKELGELRGNDIINNTSNMLNKPSASAKKLQANVRRCSESSQNSNLSSNSNQSGMQKDINDADGSGGGLIDTQNAYCHMCKRKFYSYNFLRNHMSKIHNMSLPKRSMNGNVIDDS